MKTNCIIKRIEIASNRVAVFDALTNSSSIRSYFPIDDVISDWKVGSSIKFIGEQSGVDEGVIDVLDYGFCFRYSYWNENHGSEKTSQNLVTIEYSMEGLEDDNITRLTLVQTNLPSDEYRENMEPIWDFLLAQLKTYVESK